MFGKFLNRLGIGSAAARIREEQLYELVVEEVSRGEKRNGLWAKALANSDGNEDKAKALYIGYRVQSIKDELKIIEKERRIAEKEKPPTFTKYMLYESAKGGWVVIEPSGKRVQLKTLEEIEEYKKSIGEALH